MPDISMCANDDCPSRTACRRHPDSGTRPSTFQSLMYFTPPPGADRCGGYLPKEEPIDDR